ncbi:hypothetical protein EYC80_011042 [Monilinia laxa]|uniref:AB hydrolase-1 domain-containing protein n=1 Tax=Monilinia laxa TaxID=61186 RepID=A0A5N6JNT9_MONLA|nr:hypothetical protein EYC80_011042 [Monilinia laxa]
MALTHLTVPGKILELEDGIKYAYIHIPATSSKPTFLLLHGFPSASYDWRHQIPYLKGHGYGLLVPDLLGYGDTDKPTDLERYKKKSMTADLVQILDHENLEKVIGVGHDWGVGLLSALANYYQNRLSGLVFISVSYIAPGPYDIDTVNALTQEAFGYPVWGYWEFHNEDDAHEIMGSNIKSTTALFYPSDPVIWKTHLGPVGAAKAWIASNTLSPLPKWLSESEARVHDEIFKNGGFAGPLNWYKAAVRNINVEDDAKIPKEQIVQSAPTLVIVSDGDYATRAEIAYIEAPKLLRNFEIKKFEGCGHWIPLEKRDELSEALIKFADGL